MYIQGVCLMLSHVHAQAQCTGKSTIIMSWQHECIITEKHSVFLTPIVAQIKREPQNVCL